MRHCEILSRRPKPDLTGRYSACRPHLNVLHVIFCGNPKAHTGVSFMKRYPGMLPKPLDDVISKAWGYASEKGRHLREGRLPDREEVELVVGLAATVATYLAAKSRNTTIQ